VARIKKDMEIVILLQKLKDTARKAAAGIKIGTVPGG